MLLSVPLEVSWSVGYTSDNYYKQPPVNVYLTGLMCALKFQFLVYRKIEFGKY